MNRFSRILFLAPLFVIACSSSEPAADDNDNNGGGDAGGAGGAGGANAGGAGQGGMVESLPAGCFLGAANCQPLTNDSCAADEACGVSMAGGTTLLSCGPPPNTQQLGQGCDAVIGPFCAGTMTCFHGTCAAFCCSNDDCQGVPCTPIDSTLGTLGACAEPPMCQPSGGSCSTGADCCSNDCHAGHCH